MANGTPSLYEWAGGQPALERLTARFYERVALDPVLPRWGWGEVGGPYVKD